VRWGLVRRFFFDSRRFGFIGLLAREAIDPIGLGRVLVDFGQSHLAEERNEVQPQPDFVAINPLGTALSFGDDFVFVHKDFSGLPERLLGLLDDAGAGLAT
jgi:hypothetical protein